MATEIVIGLTGLSRSGKTTIIASIAQIIENLTIVDRENPGRNMRPLVAERSGFFSDKRIKKSKVINDDSQKKGTVTYPYKQVIQQLLGKDSGNNRFNPEWPTRTTERSELSLSIAYTQKRSYIDPLRFFQPITQNEIKLTILDYPGEWLNDLQLLEMNYFEWCMECIELFKRSPLKYNEKALAWAAENMKLSPFDLQDPEKITEHAKKYQSLLKSLNDEGVNHLLSPGRLITANENSPSDHWYFFPLLSLDFEDKKMKEGFREMLNDDGYLKETGRTFLFTRLKKRYEKYKKYEVESFLKDYFGSVSDQIVLVDCIKAIEGGADSIMSLKLAFTRMLTSFNKISSGFWDTIIEWFSGNTPLKRSYFVSTKADLVGQDQVQNLENMLKNFASDVQSDSGSYDYSCYACSAIRTTTWHTREKDGLLLNCVKGTVEDTGENRIVRQPEVPDSPADFLTCKPKCFVKFKNPGPSSTKPKMLPSMGISNLINDILNKAV